jgi:hypothetical protein
VSGGAVDLLLSALHKHEKNPHLVGKYVRMCTRTHTLSEGLIIFINYWTIVIFSFLFCIFNFLSIFSVIFVIKFDLLFVFFLLSDLRNSSLIYFLYLISLPSHFMSMFICNIIIILFHARLMSNLISLQLH